MICLGSLTDKLPGAVGFRLLQLLLGECSAAKPPVGRREATAAGKSATQHTSECHAHAQSGMQGWQETAH